MPSYVPNTTPASRYLATAPRLGVESAHALADLMIALEHAYDDLPAEVQSSYAQAVTKLSRWTN